MSSVASRETPSISTCSTSGWVCDATERRVSSIVSAAFRATVTIEIFMGIATTLTLRLVDGPRAMRKPCLSLAQGPRENNGLARFQRARSERNLRAHIPEQPSHDFSRVLAYLHVAMARRHIGRARQHVQEIGEPVHVGQATGR